MLKGFLLRVLLITSLFPFPFDSNGQFTFTRDVSNGLNGIYGGAMVITNDGDCLFNAAINADNLMLMRTDANGLKIYEQLIAPLPFNKVELVDEIQNGDFFLYIKNDFTFSTIPLASVKIDPSGNPLFIKNYYANVNVKINEGVRSDSGSVYFGGSIHDGSGSDTDMLLVKLDSNSNFVWARSISLPGSQTVTSVTPTLTGGCAFTGTDSTGLDRYVVRFASSGTLDYARQFTLFNNLAIRPVRYHQTDSGSIFLTANYYTLLPTEKFAASLIMKLNNPGVVISSKAFIPINGVSSLFTKEHWIYEDPNHELRVHGSAGFYNPSANTIYDAPYYLKLGSQFNVISSKFTPLFDCETTVIDMARSGSNDFVQVLEVKDHYTSFPQIEDATAFRKFDVVTNGCINTSPTLITDTTFTLLPFLNFIVQVNSHNFSDSTFNLLPPVNSNFSIFGCTPASLSSSPTELNTTVYPNPSTTNIKVEVASGNNSSYNFQVFSTTGALMLSGKLNDGNIDISTLPPQVYFLKIISDDEIGNFVFVKIAGQN